MANEFKVKNGLIVIGDLTTSGTITINGALAATQSWVTSQAYLTSASLSGYATQSYVTSAISALIDAAPAALDTLNELAAALGDDANFSTSITNSIASKLPLAGGTLTGDLNLNYGYPRINFYDDNHNPDYSLINNDGGFSLYDITNNVHRLWVSSTGNVGVNTTGPSYRFQVNGNAAFATDSGGLRIDSYDGDTAVIRPTVANGSVLISDDSGTLARGTEFLNGGGIVVQSLSGFAPLEVKSNSTSRLSVATNGYVGIGISNPLNVLEVRNGSGTTGYSGNDLVFYNGNGQSAFYHDAGGYVYWYSNQAITFYPGASRSVTFSTNGRVGIGTTSPAGKLSIEGDGTEYSNIVFKQSAAQEHLIYASLNYQYNLIGSGSPVWIWGQQGGSERMRLDNTNLGIGTTGPSQKLHIYGSGDQALFVENSSTYHIYTGLSSNVGYVGSNNATPLSLRTNGNSRLYIDTSGNVGIGTTSPSYKLDVSGTARFTQSITLNQSAVVKKRFDSGTNNPVKTASGVLTSRSDNGGGSTYYVIETNVPQDEYQMGGFTIELFGNYSSTNHKTKIDLGGYWNPEGNGGFIGFEAHGSNPQYKPTIEVARNTSTGNTAFIIYGLSWNYPVIVARDLWLGYSGTDGGAYGEGWSIIGTETISGYSNRDTVVWRNAYSDSNPAGYITGYTETDTLQSVTSRGATTNNRLEFQYSVDRYSQAWRNTSTGAYWWVTTDSDKLGLHLNGDGDKFYFGNNGDFYSTANGWLSSALAAKQNASTAITTSNIGSQSVSYANNAGYAGYVNNQAGQLLRYDNRIISPSETNAGYLQFGFTSWNNNGGDPYADYLHMRSYDDSSGGSDNLVMFLKSGIGMRIYQQTFGSATAYSSYADVWTSANFTSTNVSNWNTAYGWGNHASAGYLTSFTETDTLASVTGRGNTTNSDIIVNGVTTIQNGGYLKFIAGSVGTTGFTVFNAAQNGYLSNRITTSDHVRGWGWELTDSLPITASPGVFFRVGYNGNPSFLTSGNFGIGTSSPSEKLHVSGAAIFDGGAGNSSTDAVVYITKSTNDDWGLYVNNAGLDYGMYTRTSPSANYAFAIHNGTTWTTRITGNAIIYLGEKDAIRGNSDSWLRLNNSNDYTSGVYTPGIMRADGGFNVSGNTVWHAANDGSGSGLDADLLDGQDSSVFLRLLPGGAEASLDSYTDNGVRSVSFAGHSQHLLSWNAGGSTGTVQQLFHYGTPNNGWRIRNKTDNSSWSDWGYVVMASSNQGLISGTIATQSWVGSQSYATTSYVTTQINNLINGAPGALDTLDELAAALGDDSNFATTVTNSIAGKVSKAGDTMTGNLTLAGGTNILFTGGSHAIAGNNTGYLHFYDYTNVYFNNQLVIRGGIQNDGGNVLIDDNLNVNGELAFPDGAGAYSNIIRSAPYPSEGYPSGLNFWMEYRAKGGHHFILNTDGGVGAGLASMDDFVIWQGAIDGNRLLEVSNIGNLWIAGALTEASSFKLKENIETSEGNLEKVVNLRPVTYNKIGSQTTELGLIAEEVAEVYPEFVQYDENGEPIGVHYSRLTAALIGAVKELNEQLQELKRNK